MSHSHRLCVVLTVLTLASVLHAESVQVCFRSGASLTFVDRTVPDGQTALQAATNGLVAGPNAEEQAQGISSAIPLGTTVKSVSLTGDTTVIDLSPEVLTALSDESMAAMYDQARLTVEALGLDTSVRLTSGGELLMSYLAPAPMLPPVQGVAAPMSAEPLPAGNLSGHSLTLAPGHGWTWTGSSWNTQRPQTCAPLLEEDFHNVELLLHLKAYLEAEGAVIIPTRCVDKNYGTDNVTTAYHIASGKPWWQMTANNWAQHLGYPCSIYAASTGDCVTGQGASEAGDDYRARALKSNADGTEMFFSIHTNALSGNCYGLSCPTGTETFWNNQMVSDIYEGPSQALANFVQTAFIDTVRAQSDPAWSNRGVKQASGAYTEMNVAAKPTILLEVGFHDSCDRDASAEHLRDNWWRSLTMWSSYKAICDFYGTTPTYGIYGAEYVSDTIPTEMIVGHPYAVTVTLRNIGVMWKAPRGYRLGAVGDSDPFAGASQTVSGEVDFQATHTFTFEMLPQVAGDFTTDWQMVRDGYGWFGPIVSKTVHVLPSDDLEPPSVPTGLAGHALSQTSIQLNWAASTDNIRVVGYEIRRDGAVIGTSATHAYTDTTCSEDTEYVYEVRAYDFPHNYSAWSASATVRTPVYDFEPPTVPQNLTVLSATLTSVQIGWDASTDNVNLVGYEVRRNGATLATVSGTTYTDGNHQPGETFTYEVRAKDWVPNFSEWSAPLVAGTLPDIEPPTVPTDLLAVAAGPTRVLLTWTGSTDNYTLTGYEVSRDGVALGTSPTNTYTDNTAVANTAYVYEVRARDAVPNYSAYSSPASATTPTAAVVVFQDGFNGNMDNWVQQIPFTYGAGVTHNSFPGTGSAKCALNASSQMYKPFERPFAEGKVSAWYRDPRGGRGSTCSFLGARQVLSLRDSSGAGFILDNGLSENGIAHYTWRLLGCGGAGLHTPYANRLTTSACRPQWFYFETQVVANPPDTFPAATFFVRMTDPLGTVESWQVIPGQGFYTANDGGIGRITLGLGESTDADVYWDDVQFEAFTPRAPLAGEATTLSSTSIAWTFARNVDHTLYGFDVADENGNVRSPQYPATGWLTRSATEWTETGLAPNTTCTRKVRAWNGTLNSDWSAALASVTLSAPPGPASVTWERVTGSTGVRWAAAGGFGPGTVQYYRYAWDQSASYTFSGAEPVWSADTLLTTPTGSGDWYLHLQGFNAADVANGVYDYLLPCGDADTDGIADCLDNCPGLSNPTQADSNGNGTGDACESHAILAWRSVRTHRGAGPLAIALDPAEPTVESRGTPATGMGVTTIEADFDGPMSLLTPAAVAVSYWPTVDGVMGSEVNVTPAVSMVDADKLRIGVAGVPDGSCIRITLGAGTFAEAIAGDADCMARTIAGDVTGSGIVDLADLSMVKSRFGLPVADNARFDLNLSGSVELADLAYVKSRFGNTPKAVCP